MKDKRILKLALLPILTVLLFAGCSSDNRYNWRPAKMEMDIDIQVERNGNFGNTYRVYVGDVIPQYYPGREDLVGIEHFVSWLTFHLHPMDRVNNFRLILNRGQSVFEHRHVIVAGSDGKYVIEDKNIRGYWGFMDQFLHSLVYNGYVDITVEGSSNLLAGEYISMDFRSNIDIQTRD